ncbi:MAG TPA: phage tail protein [Rhodocyclaceae bacterium]|nr:phage tail protein [Rhodocyclaceae bacterium]
MKKPADLRAYLTQAIPSLAKDPDKIHVFIEKGHIASKYGKSLSFEYRYPLQLVITDYTDPVDTLIVPLLAWIAANQPDILLDPDKQAKAIGFEAEILDHHTTDIGLTLELSERVIITAVAGGGWSCEHVGEPPLPDLGGPTGWSMVINGAPLLP